MLNIELQAKTDDNSCTTDAKLTNATLAQNAVLCDVEYHLINKADWIDKCVITVFVDGKILLNWIGKLQNGLSTGENGFFLSMRAVKMYVTKRLSVGKSKWEVRSDNIA